MLTPYRQARNGGTVARFLHRLGAFSARHALIVIGLWALLAVGVAAAVSSVGAQTNNDLSLPGTGSQSVKDLLTNRFPPQQNGVNPIVFDVKQGKLTDEANRQAVTASVQAIRSQPHVFSVTNPISKSGRTAGLLSKDGQTAFAPVLLDIGSGELTPAIAGRVLNATQPARQAGITTAAGGSIGTTLSAEGTEKSEVVGILAAMLILSLVLGSLVAMGLPIITAVVGLGVALATVGLLGHVVAIPSSGPTLATMIGLGVGIDYALFLITRHQEQVRDGMPLVLSIAKAVSTSGSAIVFAGCTVVIALLSLGVAGIPLVSALGVASAIAVVAAVLVAISLLPAFLGLLGPRIQWLALPAFMHPKHTPGKGMWAAWAGVVRRHPALVATLSIAALIPLIIPAFSLQLGQEDIGATSPDTTERQAYDLISAGLGVGYNGPLQVASKLDPVAAPSEAYTEKYDKAQALKKDLEQKQKTLPQQKRELEKQQQQLQAQQRSLQKQKKKLKSNQAALERQANELQDQKALLKRQQAALEQQGPQLKSQKAALQRQGKQLKAQQQQLEAEQAQLQARQARLRREAKALGAQIRPLAEDLALIKARERVLEQRIQNSQNRPRRQARLRDRLRRVEARDARVTQELAPLRTQARELADKERRLQQQAAQLQQQADRLQRKADDLKAQQKALQSQAAGAQTEAKQLQLKAGRLKKQGVALQQKGDDLQQQADKLQKQGNALQRQADDLQKQADQLKTAQQQAKQEQQHAEKLKRQLTAMVTQAGGDARGTDPRIVNLQNGLSGTADVVALTPPQLNKKGDVVLLSAVPSTAPASTATADLVDQVRTSVLPDTNQGGGITSYVGGFTASYVDLASLISARLLLVIGTVVLLGALLLLVAFRSLLIPLQAAVTNLLSAAAAFGVLVAAFQWGWGISLLGIETTDTSVPIASYVPLMMFAGLFGLSMDYEVFLVSHIQQHHHAGEEARASVSSALMSSARITTAAALIMASVFASFVLNGDPTIKQFGVGLSVAVLLAGILVVTLAPAALTLFGRAAWWLPAWLDRFLPHISVEGETTPPTPPTPPPPPRPTVGGGPSPVLPITKPGPIHPARHRDV